MNEVARKGVEAFREINHDHPRGYNSDVAIGLIDILSILGKGNISLPILLLGVMEEIDSEICSHDRCRVELLTVKDDVGFPLGART
ncbi:hypothetical protein V6N11_072987 [Hibiscus sabdariffa]|uniref:Uncharacterized protein n=1 Tax=Hibiscus sabdariffa TaxID=183260 RepID=A0ABR2NXF9_9ROSI